MRAPIAACLLSAILLTASCGGDASSPGPATGSDSPTVRGLVTDAESGDPVAGAVVQAVQGDVKPDDPDSTLLFELGATRTDATGSFELPGLEGNVTATVLVTARGFAPQGRAFPGGFDAGSVTQADFALRPAGSLVGTFLDAEGEPVAGGIVMVGPTGGDGQGPREDRTVRTREDGSFRVDGLAFDAEYGVAGSAPDGSLSQPIRGLRPTRAEPEVTADLRLATAGTIVLHVRDDTGARVPSQMARRGKFAPVFAETDEDGDLVFADVPPGSVPIAVGGDDHIRATLVVELAAGQTIERHIVLERGAVLEGVVLDERGEPIEGAEVSADRPPLPAYDLLPASTASTDTDESGRFRLTGLRRGPHLVEAWAEGHNRAELAEFAAPASGVEIVLPRTGSVAATLTSGPVSVYAEYVQRQGDSEIRYDGGEHEPDGSALVLDEVPSGPVEIRLFAPDHGMTVLAVTVPPGGTLAYGDLALARGFSVHGRVVDLDGEPIPHAEIRNLTWAYALEEPVVADAEGRFTLENLSEATWQLAIHAEGFVSMRTAFETRAGVDNPPVHVKMPRGGVLIVRLASEQGAPAADVPVRVASLDENDRSTGRWSLRTDREGAASIRRPAGRYAVTWGSERRVITLEEGEQTELRGVLDR